MEEFTQKWAVVALLKDIQEGDLFPHTNFPLHITLAGVFKMQHSGKRIALELQSLLADSSSFTVMAKSKDMFGPNKDVTVMRIKESSELMQLYELIHSHLISLGATFNTPQYEGSGYIAHSTIQQSESVVENEDLQINTIALIDLFPNRDGCKRNIFKKITLK